MFIFIFSFFTHCLYKYTLLFMSNVNVTCFFLLFFSPQATVSQVGVIHILCFSSFILYPLTLLALSNVTPCPFLHTCVFFIPLSPSAFAPFLLLSIKCCPGRGNVMPLSSGSGRWKWLAACAPVVTVETKD